MINLGNMVQDKITGFRGMAVAKHIYLNGCVRYSVVSKELESGKIIDEYIDETQLVILEKEKEKAKELKKEEKPPGGPGDVPSGYNVPPD